MTDRPRAHVIAALEGTILRSPVGGTTILKARAETTGGSFTLLENLVPPHQGPPLHLHGNENEMWYVLDGNFRFRADEEILHASTGSFVFVPRGTRHCFQNIGDEQARILVMFMPSGMEAFFEAHAALPPGPVDPETYRLIAAAVGMSVAGPPLAVSDPI
ncbi:MAG: cupin domain-containing protein [Chloroflexi bacterium]|nr:cupin domain-containing protein [Chloroflexota bacterium]